MSFLDVAALVELEEAMVKVGKVAAYFEKTGRGALAAQCLEAFGELEIARAMCDEKRVDQTPTPMIELEIPLEEIELADERQAEGDE